LGDTANVYSFQNVGIAAITPAFLLKEIISSNSFIEQAGIKEKSKSF
jgi:hypothetical protein